MVAEKWRRDLRGWHLDKHFRLVVQLESSPLWIKGWPDYCARCWLQPDHRPKHTKGRKGSGSRFRCKILVLWKVLWKSFEYFSNSFVKEVFKGLFKGLFKGPKFCNFWDRLYYETSKSRHKACRCRPLTPLRRRRIAFACSEETKVDDVVAGGGVTAFESRPRFLPAAWRWPANHYA